MGQQDLAQAGEVVCIENGNTTDKWLGLAVDLGTTTMASYLCDMHTGETLATESLMNPQIRIGGDDVMNRIAASDNPEKLDRMQKAVTNTLSELADRVTHSVGCTAEDISEIVLVANTCMHHIFLAWIPIRSGKSPFMHITLCEYQSARLETGTCIAVDQCAFARQPSGFCWRG